MRLHAVRTHLHAVPLVTLSLHIAKMLNAPPLRAPRPSSMNPFLPRLQRTKTNDPSQTSMAIQSFTSQRPECAALAQLNHDEWVHDIKINGVSLNCLPFGSHVDWDGDWDEFLEQFNLENASELVDRVFVQRTSKPLTGAYRVGCPCGRKYRTKDADCPEATPLTGSNESRLANLPDAVRKRRRRKRERRTQKVECPFFVQLKFHDGRVEIRGRYLTHLRHPRRMSLIAEFKVLTSEQRDDLCRRAAELSWDRVTLRREAERLVNGTIRTLLTSYP